MHSILAAYDKVKYISALSSVDTISSSAFSGCSSLQSLSIDSSHPQIDSDAFTDNTLLNDVTFSTLSASQVKSAYYYPWALQVGTMIHCLDTSFPVRRATTIVEYNDGTVSEISIKG